MPIPHLLYPLSPLFLVVSKVRLAAMEKIAAFAQDPSNARQHCQTLAQGMGTALPGWGEKNFQVMSRQFDVVQAMASFPSVPFGKSDALVGINGGFLCLWWGIPQYL